jgi:hypothetical protein
VLEFTFIAQTFETMASPDAPDDVKVLSTNANTILAGRGFDVLLVSKRYTINRPHFIKFLNVACLSFVVDGEGNVSYPEVEIVRLLLSIGTVFFNSSEAAEVACPLVGSTLNANFVLASFIKTSQFFVAAPEVPFTTDSVPVVTYNLAELPTPVFIIRPEDDKGSNTVTQAAAFVSAVNRGHWVARFVFASAQVPLALDDLFNFSKDESQIIRDRIGGAISWFPHLNRIISSGAETNTAKLASLFNLGSSLQSNAVNCGQPHVARAPCGQAPALRRRVRGCGLVQGV